jgi:group I intron endonuclease
MLWYNYVFNKVCSRDVSASGSVVKPVRRVDMSILSGIYEIRNTINGKRYIGSAVDTNKRWRTHKSHLNRGLHKNPHLQNAWNKYGANAFKFSVIETCFVFALIFREQHYIDTLRPEYNIRKRAESNLGLKSSPETKMKLSILGRNMSPETRAKIAAANMGNTHSRGIKRKQPVSLETRKKLSEANMGNKSALGAVRSAETRAKMSEAQRNKSPEHRARISAAKTGQIVTPEPRAKLSAAQKGKKRGPYKKKEITSGSDYER